MHAPMCPAPLESRGRRIIVAYWLQSSSRVNKRPFLKSIVRQRSNKSGHLKSFFNIHVPTMVCTSTHSFVRRQREKDTWAHWPASLALHTPYRRSHIKNQRQLLKNNPPSCPLSYTHTLSHKCTRTHYDPDTHRNRAAFFPLGSNSTCGWKACSQSIIHNQFYPLELILNLLGTECITKVIIFPK